MHDGEAGADDAEVVLKGGEYQGDAGVVGEIAFLKADVVVEDGAEYGDDADSVLLIVSIWGVLFKKKRGLHWLTINPLQRCRSGPPSFGPSFEDPTA